MLPPSGSLPREPLLFPMAAQCAQTDTERGRRDRVNAEERGDAEPVEPNHTASVGRNLRVAIVERPDDDEHRSHKERDERVG